MAMVESAILRIDASQANNALTALNAKLRAFEAANARMAAGMATASQKQVAATGRTVEAYTKQSAAADRAATGQAKAADKAALAQAKAAERAAAAQVRAADVAAAAQQKAADRAIAAQGRVVERQQRAADRAARQDVSRQLNTARVEQQRRAREEAGVMRDTATRMKLVNAQIRDQQRLEQATARKAERVEAVARRETATAERVAQSMARSEARQAANRARSEERQQHNDYRFLARHSAHAAGVPYSVSAAGVHGLDMYGRMPGTVAAVTGAAVAGHIAKTSIGAAGDRDLVLKQLDALGYNKDVDLHGMKIGDKEYHNVNAMAAAKAQANALSKRYSNVSETDALDMTKEGTSVFGDRAHAIEGAEHLARMSSFLNTYMGGHAGADYRREAFAAVKSAEIAGKATMEKKDRANGGRSSDMEEYMQSMAIQKIVYGETANFQQYLMAQRAGGNALMGTSDDFRFGIFPALVQEFGSGAGVQMATSFRHMIGSKKYTKKELAQMESYGLYNAEKDKFKYSDEFKINPFDAALKTADAISKKDFKQSIFDKDGNIVQEALDKVKGVAPEVIGRMFADRKAAQAQVEQIFQAPKLIKDLNIYRQVKADMDRIAKGDLFNSRTMGGAQMAVKKQWENVEAKIAEGFSGPAIGGMNTLAGMLNSMSDFALKNPALSLGGAAVGGIGAIALAGKAINYFSGAAALTGAAGSLTGSAAAISAAAARLGVAGGVGKGGAVLAGAGAAGAAGAAAKSGLMARMASGAWSATKIGAGWLGLAMTLDMLQSLATGVSLTDKAVELAKKGMGFKTSDKAAEAGAAKPTADETNLAALIREIDALDATRDAARIKKLTAEAEALNASIEKSRANAARMDRMVEYAAGLPEDPRAVAWAQTAQAREQAAAASVQAMDRAQDAEQDAAQAESERIAKGAAKTGYGTNGAFGNYQDGMGDPLGGGEANPETSGFAKAVSGFFDWLSNLKPGTIGAPDDAAAAGDGLQSSANSLAEALMSGGATVSSDLSQALSMGASELSSAGSAIEAGGSSAASFMESAIINGGSSAAATIAAAIANASVNINVGAASAPGKPANTGANMGGR